ncbi:unnamed protein product [Paramecium sonneborni]|uniref:Uncharacterized protein n=1 Tax=Paramecium sonneborni TaxID=65129 RepID=A0A8S1L5D1_9CILI|nr:unnamed protein product [Paramecium sonneborni]
MKQNKRYNTLTDKQRAEIMELKNYMSSKQISKELKINIKTIQSVKYSERQSEYKIFIEAVIQYVANQSFLVSQINDEKKFKKLVRKKVHEAIFPKETSQFTHLLPIQKQNSNKKRIIEQIFFGIQKKILTSPSDFNNLSPIKNKEKSSHSPSYSEIDFRNDQNIQHSPDFYFKIQKTYDDIEVQSEIIPYFESSSINSSTTSQFINELSEEQLGFQ